MSYGDTEPSEFHGGVSAGPAPFAPASRVTFDRRAVFSVFRRASEVPLYRIEKSPKLARRQGAYSVISATGLIVRRGHELDRVLNAIDTSLSVVAG
jgi:Protein of unknown function (DUF2794)